MLLDILDELLNPMAKMVQLEIKASDGHKLFHDFALSRHKVRDNATCVLPFPLKLQLGFQAQTQKPSTGGFEAQTIESKAYPLRLLRNLDMCYHHPRPPNH